MRIVLFCDQKWRDLPSLAVVKLYLEAAGHMVFIFSTKEAEALLAAFKPHCVVFNHIFDKRYINLAHRLKNAGTRVMILPTEGATPTFLWGPMVHGEFTDYSMVDLYLSWNKITADGIVAAGKIPPESMRVVGCARFDFAVPPLRNSCMTRAEFCSSQKLDPLRPIIVFASRFALAKMTYASASAVRALRESMYEIGYTQCVEQLGFQLDDVFALYRLGLDSFIEAFIAVAKAFPNCQLVFKPHPNDDVNYIKNAVGSDFPSNVNFCLGAYIGDVLRACDVLVNSDCNTSMEAWVQGVPVVDVQIRPDHITGRPDIQACNPVAASNAEVIELVRDALSGDRVTDQQKESRCVLLDKWFDVIDGNRGQVAAREIDAYLRTAAKLPGSGLSITEHGHNRTIRTAIRHFFNVPGGSSIIHHLRRGGKDIGTNASGVFDKVITRSDVKEAIAKVRPWLVDGGNKL